MGDPEVLEGRNDALQDTIKANHDVVKPSQPSDCVDRPPSKTTLDESAAADDHHRRTSGRTRTVRVRDGFFDSSLLHYVSLSDPAVSKDGLPSRRSPKPAKHHSQTKHHIEEGDDEDWDGTQVGPEHQATNIPPCTPRPAQPTASEARFLQAKPLYMPVEPEVVEMCEKTRKTRAGLAGVTVPMPPIGVAASSSDFRYKWRWCKDNAAHCALLSAAINALDKQLGPDMVEKLHLGDMGFKLRDKWQKQEELLFALGMCDKYRMFKYIRQCYLCGRTLQELNVYYHNVWKTRSTNVADEFLTMRELGATRAEYGAFVDKVRDELVSMWDRKTMGDMPKLVKHLAAAAAAERAAAAAGGAKQQQQHHQQQHQPSQQQRSKPRSHSRPPQQADVYYSDDSDFQDRGAASDSSYSLSDSDTERGAARRKSKQQRKRSFVPMSSDAISRQGWGGKRHSNGQAAASQQAYRWQQHSNGGRAFDLPAPSGTGLQQWLHPGHPGAQQPRTAMQRQPASQPGICTLAPLQLPEMPRAPRQPSSTLGVSDWLRGLPDFRHSLSSHLEAVDHMTELAIDECQRYIQSLQKQRQAREEEARQYLDVVMRQGRQILTKLAAEETEIKQQQQQHTQPQQPHHAQQFVVPDKQQWQPVVVSLADLPGQVAQPWKPPPAAAAAISQPLAQQPQQQQQRDVDMSDAPSHRQEGYPAAAGQDGAVQDAAPGRSVMGPPPPRAPWQGPAASSQKQLQEIQQQQQQEPDTAAGADNGAAALPFPGGPTLGAWGLGQWTSMGSAPTPAPMYTSPNTYVRTPTLPSYTAGLASAAAGHPQALHAGMVHKPVPRVYLRK